MWTGIVRRTVILSVPLLILGILESSECCTWLGKAHAQAGIDAKVIFLPEAAIPDPRSEDRAAIRGALQPFVKAFESRDPKALQGNTVIAGSFVSPVCAPAMYSAYPNA